MQHGVLGLNLFVWFQKLFSKFSMKLSTYHNVQSCRSARCVRACVRVRPPETWSWSRRLGLKTVSRRAI